MGDWALGSENLRWQIYTDAAENPITQPYTVPVGLCHFHRTVGVLNAFKRRLLQSPINHQRAPFHFRQSRQASQRHFASTSAIPLTGLTIHTIRRMARIPSNPLLSLPELSPHSPDFSHGDRLSQECLDELKLKQDAFLWRPGAERLKAFAPHS